MARAPGGQPAVQLYRDHPAGPERDYNYAGNTTLTEAIASGERGAYWDILRRLRP